MENMCFVRANVTIQHSPYKLNKVTHKTRLEKVVNFFFLLCLNILILTIKTFSLNSLKGL